MRYKCPLIAVKNKDRTIKFYHEVLGLDVILDFGANFTLTGGIVCQTIDSWREFIEGKDINLCNNAGELYFEEDDFDGFINRLSVMDIDFVHHAKEHSWGQRVVRFYDPDKHIIEVGENMATVCQRFYNSGMSVEEVAKRIDTPVEYVKEMLKEKE